MVVSLSNMDQSILKMLKFVEVSVINIRQRIVLIEAARHQSVCN